VKILQIQYQSKNPLFWGLAKATKQLPCKLQKTTNVVLQNAKAI